MSVSTARRPSSRTSTTKRAPARSGDSSGGSSRGSTGSSGAGGPQLRIPTKYWPWVVVAILVIAIVSAIATRSESQEQGAPTGPPGSVAATLATLPVQTKASMSGYSREKFGPAWADVDHNGCDTRDDILARDLTKVSHKRGDDCVVSKGTLADPYSGRTIAFTRGVKTSSAVQIDHMVPLGNAWRTGAQKLSADQREALANDPLNLVAADGPLNEQKSDDDASEWLPPNTAFQCTYVAHQVAVKKKYGLWVTSAERSAMQRVLTTCPDEALPS